MGRKIASVVATLLLIGLVGCGSGNDAVTVTYDGALSSSLRDLSAQRGSARLSDLTSFEWDTVNVFAEGVTSERVEQVIGANVLKDKRYYDAGNLLVFKQRGTVVRTVSVVPDLLKAKSDQGYGTETELVPFGPGTPAVLLLCEP